MSALDKIDKKYSQKGMSNTMSTPKPTRTIPKPTLITPQAEKTVLEIGEMIANNPRVINTPPTRILRNNTPNNFTIPPHTPRENVKFEPIMIPPSEDFKQLSDVKYNEIAQAFNFENGFESAVMSENQRQEISHAFPDLDLNPIVLIHEGIKIVKFKSKSLYSNPNYISTEIIFGAGDVKVYKDFLKIYEIKSDNYIRKEYPEIYTPSLSSKNGIFRVDYYQSSKERPVRMMERFDDLYNNITRIPRKLSECNVY